MPVRDQTRPYSEVAQKWRALAERRRAHFTELLDSGRWKHYYTQEQFRAEMDKVVEAAERWAKIAGEETPPEREPD